MTSNQQETLGTYLKREREKRNISIEQLAYATRIGIKMLRSLEEDLHDQLPAQPFVRGYLQAYGKYAGLDIQDLLLRYQHHQATHPEVKKASLRSHYVYMKERYQERRQLLLVLSLFVVMLACAATYMILKRKHDLRSASKVQIALKDTAPTQPITATKTSTASSVVATLTKVSVSATATQSAVATKTADVDSNSTAPKKYNLTIKSGLDVWVRYQTDNEAIKHLTLHEGATMTLRANKVIKLFSGNLAALQVTFNGQEIKTLIQPGRAMSAVLPESEIPNYPLPLFPSLNSSTDTSTASSHNSSSATTGTSTQTN